MGFRLLNIYLFSSIREKEKQLHFCNCSLPYLLIKKSRDNPAWQLIVRLNTTYVGNVQLDFPRHEFFSAIFVQYKSLSWNYRIFWVGKNPQGSLYPTSGPAQDNLKVQTISKCFLNSSRLGAVTTFPGSLISEVSKAFVPADCPNPTVLCCKLTVHVWWIGAVLGKTS